MIRVLELSGTAYSMGKQHAGQVLDLRPHILAAVQARLGTLREQGKDFIPYVREIDEAWRQYAPATLEALRGIAEGLNLPWEDYFTYTISSYLNSRLRRDSQPGDGCTSWAAGTEFGREGIPLLVKNRDYRPDHQPLQCLARVRPEKGYPYICLTSAGSPGVFSSGINRAGLAAVDTFVPSDDTGPGIARYSFMTDLLERFSSVPEAVDYLHTCPHFGDGTVTVLDAQGEMATFEIAHSVQATRKPEEGFIVSTNHFSAPETRALWTDTEPPHLQGNTLERRRRVEDALRTARGQVDVPWAQELMSLHGGGLKAVCRHAEVDPLAVTISCVIFSPQQATMWVANGLPCSTIFENFQVEN